MRKQEEITLLKTRKIMNHMSKNIIIVRSAVPEIRRRQDEADFFNPLLGMTNGEYWAREREKCRNDFKYWFEKYIVINNSK